MVWKALALIIATARGNPPCACRTCLYLTLTLAAFSDYINPIDLCNRLNTYIIPEAAVHGFLTFLFLINGYWLPLIINLPLLGWNIKKCVASDCDLLPPEAFGD